MGENFNILKEEAESLSSVQLMYRTITALHALCGSQDAGFRFDFTHSWLACRNAKFGKPF